jgi:hypothetical protein
MIAKQLNAATILGSRPIPIREDSDSSLLEVNRPRKRVKISFDQPKLHRCKGLTLANDPPFSQQTRSRETSAEFRRERAQPHPEQQQWQQQNSWLTPCELSYFRSNAKKVSKSVNLDSVLQDIFDETSSENELSVRTNKLLQNDDFLIQRGLERWSSTHHSFLRKVKVLEVKAAVFLEQATQVLSGRSDPETLSKVSVEASRASQSFAQFLAGVDAEMAMEVHASDM